MRELTPVPGRRAGDGAGTRHSDKTAKNGAVAESRRLFEPRNPASTQAANFERSRRALRSRHRGLPRGLSRYPEKRERTRPEQGRCFVHSTTLSPGLLRLSLTNQAILLSRNCKALQLCVLQTDNDPSAGSPTETLLRLLLSPSDRVRASSRPTVPALARQTETNPRPSLNRSIDSSDGRCVQRAGT